MDAVDQARSDARDLYKKIEAGTTKNHATVRADLQDAASKEQRLASSLKTVAQDQRTDAKAHLEHAAVMLEAAASAAKSVAQASDAELRVANLAMLERTRDAVQDVSRAVAAKRGAAAKQPVPVRS